jgi:hypothetical protein
MCKVIKRKQIKAAENKKEKHFTFVGMDNLPALLPNVTPLVSRFFAEMSK